MKLRLLILFVFTNISLACFSQKFNFTVGSSNILFERLYNRKVLFNGLSFNYAYYFKRFGWTMDLNFYLPSEYYGKVMYYYFNSDMQYVYNEIPVYIKGGGFSVGPGITYKLYVSKSQKFIIQTDANALILSLVQNFNSDPFIRIYGSSDFSAPTIYSVSFGLKFTHKIGYIPLSFSLRRHFNIQSKIHYQNFSGYTELKLGISFPIVFGPPPSTITKINY